MPSKFQSNAPATTLASFPEELLERILALCVVAPLYPPARPAWHCSQGSQYEPSAANPNHGPTNTRGRLAPLLVCKAFNRIATPLFYHTVHVRTQGRLQRLLKYALYPNPALARYVRRIVFGGVWSEGGTLLRMCQGVRVLEVTLDAGTNEVYTSDRESHEKAFCLGLMYSTGVSHLTIRKPANVYLTQAKPRQVLYGVAKAIQNWTHLESAHIAFRLSDDSISFTSPSSQKSPQPGPITLLTYALRASPRLHTFVTMVPSLWNESILRVSENPRLERIVLGDGNVDGAGEQQAGAAAHGIVGTGLFLMQARKHARLSDLIRAGTPIIRSRAHTMGTVASSSCSSPSSPASTTPCPPIRKGVSAGNSSSPSACPSSSSHRFPTTWDSQAYHYQPQHHRHQYQHHQQQQGDGGRSSSRSRLLSSTQ